MRKAQPISSRETPHWSRVCVNALLVLGVVAMMNMLGVNPDSMTAGSSYDTAMTHSSTTTSVAGTDDPDHQISPVVSAQDSGTSMADCCGLVMLCIAMIAAISAFVLSCRTPGGRVMWQVPRPHTFALGRVIAPFSSTTPLQRTAVLRL